MTKNRFAVTANVFTAAAVMALIGPFDDRLQSGGDADWGKRVHAAGYELVYAPEAVVRHPARPTFRALVVAADRVARGRNDRWRHAPASAAHGSFRAGT